MESPDPHPAVPIEEAIEIRSRPLREQLASLREKHSRSLLEERRYAHLLATERIKPQKERNQGYEVSLENHWNKFRLERSFYDDEIQKVELGLQAIREEGLGLSLHRIRNEGEKQEE